jgi:hypothetical protein
MTNQQNIDAVKMYVYYQFSALLDKLQKRWGQNSDFSQQEKLLISTPRIEEEEYK